MWRRLLLQRRDTVTRVAAENGDDYGAIYRDRHSSSPLLPILRYTRTQAASAALSPERPSLSVLAHQTSSSSIGMA
jgi:hypothetical protein